MANSGRHLVSPSASSWPIDAHGELLASLKRIISLHPPVHTCSTGWSFSGLYSGPTSIAFLFYKLSQIYPDLDFEHQSFLEWAQAYIQLGARTHKHEPTPDHCGIGDETLARLAVEAVISGDASFARQLCSYAEVINSPEDDGSNEWQYGRAGYLYLLRLCQTAFPQDVSPESAARLKRTIASTVERILDVPQPWKWRGERYIGAAHGSIGIITQVVLSVPSVAPRLRTLLMELLDQQLPSGNFPLSLSDDGSDDLVQFCHGGPGFVISLRAVLSHYPDMRLRIANAISRARSDILSRGLLSKEPCLCHGIAGNALSFQSNDQYFHFLSFMKSEKIERLPRDEPRDKDEAGLYIGEAGRAWCWALADKELPRTCIGYNDV